MRSAADPRWRPYLRTPSTAEGQASGIGADHNLVLNGCHQDQTRVPLENHEAVGGKVDVVGARGVQPAPPGVHRTRRVLGGTADIDNRLLISGAAGGFVTCGGVGSVENCAGQLDGWYLHRQHRVDRRAKRGRAAGATHGVRTTKPPRSPPISRSTALPDEVVADKVVVVPSSEVPGGSQPAAVHRCR